MRPTRIRVLLALALIVATLVWAVLRLVDTQVTLLPRVPWSAPTVLGGLALVVGVATVALRPRLLGRPDATPISPLAAARVAVLAKASSHAGALFVGAYTGYLLVLPTLDADLRRDRAVAAGLSLLAGVLLVVAGLILERFCRVEPPADDDLPPPNPPTP